MINKLTFEQIVTKYHFDKHIWEGWEVRDFIRYIENDLDRIMEYGQMYAEPALHNKQELSDWIKGHLPYTIKAHRYVLKYFTDKYNGMPIAEWSNPNGNKTLKL